MMFYLGSVPFKITDVTAVCTSLSILSVCAWLPPQEDEFLKDRDATCPCVSALSTAPGTHSTLDNVCFPEGNYKFYLKGS